MRPGFNSRNSADRIIAECMDSLSDLKQMRNLISFMVIHPELSFDNQVLLFLQQEKAERFYCHKGLAEALHLNTDHPVALKSCILHPEDQKADSVLLSAYLAPEPQEHRKPSLQTAISRMGFEAVYSEHAETFRCDTERMLLLLPSDWNGRKDDKNRQEHALAEWIVDYFRTAYEESGRKFVCPIRDFQELYRDILVPMLKQYLNLKHVRITSDRLAALGKTDGMFASMNRKKRLFTLCYLWQELHQIIDGPHLTPFEAELYRLAGSELFSESFGIRSGNPDVWAAHYHFVLRYADSEIGQLDKKQVHSYPPVYFEN